ncbi:MAG: curli biogenesis system outer membrane secretion channel CsgG [Hyphomicrobiaceae bacterium]|jgi:curli biogenesis system outer membrane secretion channel CsgG
MSHPKQTTSAPAGVLIVAVVALLAGSGCAVETHRALTPETVTSAGTSYVGARHTIVVGKFRNRSSYMQGLFSDGTDRLGSQSKTLLEAHLAQSGRFSVVDRSNMAEIALESGLAGTAQKLKGASVALTGDVTEFGRKTVGDVQLFGILGQGKQQIAYAKVTVNVVDVVTSQILYAVHGAGEYALSSREVLGTGSAASYDATLNGKVLDLAIREAVNRLVEGLERGAWSPTAKP